MYGIAWLPGEQVEGMVLTQMTHGAKIQYVSPDTGMTHVEYFDVDDYVILVDVDELEGEE